MFVFVVVVVVLSVCSPLYCPWRESVRLVLFPFFFSVISL